MKKWFLIGMLVAMSFPVVQVSAGELWMDDFAAAVRKAREQNRYLLVTFTGSDWCGWCIRLNNEVFTQESFLSYAAEKLVCMDADFPRNKLLPPHTRKQNERLMNLFGVQGYPTVILFNPEGLPIARTGYQPGGAGEYVKHLDTLISMSQQVVEELPVEVKPAPGEAP